MRLETCARRLALPVVAVCSLCMTACVSWNPGWQIRAGGGPLTGDKATPPQAAEALENGADDAGKVGELIAAYERLVATDPSNYQALWKLGNYHILLGAAYSQSTRDKKTHYLDAIRYCERAMYTNPAFRKAVEGGKPVWEACELLTASEIDAMGYWYTAVFYYFKECLTPVGRLMNTRLVIHNDPVMRRIDALDPNWAGGGNHFSRALYFIALPERYGGSKVKADDCFTKAIAAGPAYLVNRWGRARYLYALTGNRDGYISDLKWVLEQDPHKSGNTYPWNVYFQRQAKEMLSDVDKVFGPKR